MANTSRHSPIMGHKLESLLGLFPCAWVRLAGWRRGTKPSGEWVRNTDRITGEWGRKNLRGLWQERKHLESWEVMPVRISELLRKEKISPSTCRPWACNLLPSQTPFHSPPGEVMALLVRREGTRPTSPGKGGSDYMFTGEEKTIRIRVSFSLTSWWHLKRQSNMTRSGM